MVSTCMYAIATLMVNIAYSCQYYPRQLPQPMYCHQITYYDATKTIYLFGGTTDNQACLSDVYKWSMSDTNSWFQNIEQTPTCFSPCVNAVVTINEFAYFIGINTTKIYIFDMLHDSWVTDMKIPLPDYQIRSGCLSTNNTHIFVAGGHSRLISQNSGYSNYLQILDVNSNTWIAEEINLSPINNGFAWGYCSMVDTTNSLYIMGGYDPIQHRTDDIYKYDIHTHEWTYIGDKSVRSDAGTAIYSPKHEAIYIIGGWNGTQFASENVSIYDEIDIFDINSENIQYEAHMLDNTMGGAAIIIDDLLYVFGGSSKYNLQTHLPTLLSTVQVCDLATTVFSTLATQDVILEITIVNSNVSVDDIINILMISYPLIVEYDYKLITTDIHKIKLEVTITVPIHGEEINTNLIKNQLDGLYGNDNVNVNIISESMAVSTAEESNDRDNNQTRNNFNFNEYMIFIIGGIIFVLMTMIVFCGSYYMLYRKRKQKTDMSTNQIELNNVNIENNYDINDSPYRPMVSPENSNSPRDIVITNDDILTEGNNINTETVRKPKVSFVIEAETGGNIDDEDIIFHQTKTKGDIDDDINPNIADDEFIVNNEQNNITKY